jgi:hypothetical protein
MGLMAARKHYLIGGASLVTIGFLAYVVSGLDAPGPAASGTATQCSLVDTSYVPLPSRFDRMVDTTISQVPLKDRSAASPPAGGFHGGRILGFINHVALSEPYISDERDQAVKLGYRMGRWPLVPLQGAVVRAQLGILEVYQVHFAFAAQADAIVWAEHIVASQRLDQRAQEVSLPLPAGFASFESTMGPNDGQHEHAVLVYGSLGKVAIQFSIQGGAGVIASAETGLILDALSRVNSACGVAGSDTADFRENVA